MPLQYVYEARDRKIQWSHSNMFRAFELPFIELRRVLELKALTDPAAAAGAAQGAPLACGLVWSGSKQQAMQAHVASFCDTCPLGCPPACRSTCWCALLALWHPPTMG